MALAPESEKRKQIHDINWINKNEAQEMIIPWEVSDMITKADTMAIYLKVYSWEGVH